MARHYCEAAIGDALHGPYHDREYGFPIDDDDALFARLVLEINQAGLSWATILKKKDNFSAAYDGFSIAAVAAYDDDQRARLLADAGIIRNRLKVNAAIENARRLLEIAAGEGSFKAWLDAYHPAELGDWVKLFRANFKFTGPEIVREFLVSTGYLPGAHRKECPIFATIAGLNPPWMQTR
ncbi:MAG: DNA-3-methyladenine glycosylase I [Alphaproteobacteria bacterium]|nr:DNA-3-methyladenine glycosylase I [Alphaproteobacteria bacterium]MDP6817311.1 DNA-3-methyladenine glycosylase I [Alphaproteobacteria bacterium]